jgi:putative ABC transport system permease protein
MKFSEAMRLALATIAAHKLRSFLTLLGIILGVATVIVVVSLIEGFNAYVEDKIANLGSNAFIVNRLGFITSFQEFVEKNKRNKDITIDDLRSILEHPVHVKTAAAMVFRRGEIKHETKSLQDFSIRGASYNMIDIDTTKVDQGRYISSGDDEHARYTCFVGHDIVNQFFPMSDPIGKSIKIEGLEFQIVGTADEIGTIFGNPQDSFVIIPLSTYQKIYGSRDSLMLRVAATGADALDSAQDEVRVVLRTRRHLNYKDDDNFGIITSDAINNLRQRIFGTISIVAVGVTSICLVVGGIVIMNMMLVSVTERTQEIGIRKSLGARRTDILKQFLAESTVLSLCGGAVGVGLAYGISKLGTLLLSLPTALPILWTTLALLVSASIGLFFGIYPAWKAAKLDPIVALRAE